MLRRCENIFLRSASGVQRALPFGNLLKGFALKNPCFVDKEILKKLLFVRQQLFLFYAFWGFPIEMMMMPAATMISAISVCQLNTLSPSSTAEHSTPKMGTINL